MALPSIYKSPEDYLQVMIAALQDRGSKITDFTIGSVTRNLFETIGVGLSEHTTVADQHRIDSYLSTATGEALTLRAADQGVDRKTAVQASGTVRITRDDTATAVTIPAGWSPLSSVPTPGTQPVQYVTLEDAVFDIGENTADVAARAVEGGTLGNIDQDAGDEVLLLPANPVPDFATDGDFHARGPFTGGVDEETDDALRARVPIEVQGRVKGRRQAFEAAALRIPGVTSAQVRQAGETNRELATIAGGNVVVYYEGDAGLLAQVTAECEAAAVLTQNVTVATASDLNVIVDLDAYVLAGLQEATLQAAILEILTPAVRTGVGNGVPFSDVVRRLHDGVPDVQSLEIPFADFRASTAPDNTCADIPGQVGFAPVLSTVTPPVIDVVEL